VTRASSGEPAKRSSAEEAAALRAKAESEPNPRLKRRFLAVAGLLDGLSLSEAARRAGTQRHTLRGWWRRYAESGVASLTDRVRPGRPSQLDDRQKAELLRLVRRDGLEGDAPAVRRLLADRFGVAYSLSGVRKLLRGLKA